MVSLNASIPASIDGRLKLLTWDAFEPIACGTEEVCLMQSSAGSKYSVFSCHLEGPEVLGNEKIRINFVNLWERPYRDTGNKKQTLRKQRRPEKSSQPGIAHP